MLYIYPSHLNSASTLPCETGQTEIIYFLLNAARCFAHGHTESAEIIICPHTNDPSFIKTTDSMHQTGLKRQKGTKYPAVSATHILSAVSRMGV